MDSSFEVTQVLERQTLNSAGNLIQNTVMYLETGRGSTGTLEIPTKDFTSLTSSDEGKQVLRGMLQDKANQLDAPFGM
jgi:hypothetical protein